MRVILTHEQADFDAIASQLGAWFLDRSAIPVLPVRVNRNVRAFLTLYGVELPFVERAYLPSKRVKFAVLVDTQSLVTLKGMQPDLVVNVVDHHEMRSGLPDNWQVRVEPVGANTTLFVEYLRERRQPLTQVEATLLLLGIYEDTGSLTYSRTTSRDLQAAAYLVDNGASLQIVGDFLNHPLSLVQQELLEHLKSVAETYEVEGNTILVACANAQDSHEELSTIAHKIRDELDPDGLVLLIQIAGGIQLIGRSTNDRVDVGAIVRHFGGGGHSRAAAALIKSEDIKSVHKRVVDCLPEYVRPALTVAQIMSRGGPQVLAPDTAVHEALIRMQRYGYEGYPVVEDGRVIGLLTRRAVDRALSHKLNVTAKAVMDAGEVTIGPGDSIEKLQHLMTDTGWGQIPVLDPETREIMGIVTRTDLLKTFAPQPAIPGRQNFAERLAEVLPPQHIRLLQIVAKEAHNQRAALFIVGGFVRDLILDTSSLDFDLVVEGDAIALARALAIKHGGRVTAHRRFGTAKWHLTIEDYGLESIDLVSARTEFYTHPTALPTVERSSIKLDLHRRDFTLNTLALRLDGLHYGDLYDYWGGLSDLRQGLIRVLHSLSFVDDPTRMLRAVRFEQRFDFRIEDRTMELLTAALGLLQRVSGDRIRHELDYVIDEPKAVQMFSRLNELGLLKAIHPDLGWEPNGRASIFSFTEPDPLWQLAGTYHGIPLQRALAYLFWLLHLPSDKVRKVTRRLKIRQSLEAAVIDACKLREDLPALAGKSPSEITDRLEKASLLAVFAVYMQADDRQIKDRIRSYAEEWRHITPETDGHRLRELGLQPGPVYKTILTKLRTAWLNGEVSSVEEERALLNQMLDDVTPEQGQRFRVDP